MKQLICASLCFSLISCGENAEVQQQIDSIDKQLAPTDSFLHTKKRSDSLLEAMDSSYTLVIDSAPHTNKYVDTIRIKNYAH